MIKLVVKEPGKKSVVREYIKLSLKTMQEIVGGYIQTLPFSKEQQDLLIVCNEEGRLIGLEDNFNYFGEPICGTIFVCKSKGSNMVGLSDDDIAYVQTTQKLHKV